MKFLMSVVFLFSFTSFGKNEVIRKGKLSHTQVRKMKTLAKKWGINLESKEGIKKFKNKLKKRRAAFKGLSISQKKKIMSTRIDQMRKRLKKSGLTEREIAKRIAKRKIQMRKRILRE